MIQWLFVMLSSRCAEAMRRREAERNIRAQEALARDQR